MQQPEHSAGSSCCSLRLGQECSQLLAAWYFPALMMETSTHSTTKQEKHCGFPDGGRDRVKPDRLHRGWTPADCHQRRSRAVCFRTLTSLERQSLPLGSRTATSKSESKSS